MTQAQLLQHIKNHAMDLYGDRFRGLVLYGSVARGEADEDSDLDLLCLLEGPVDIIRETLRLTADLYALQLQYLEMPISVKAVDVADYEHGAYPLVIEARKDGVLV